MDWPEFVKDHLIYDQAVIAGATYLSAMISVIESRYQVRSGTLSEVEFIQPVVLGSQAVRTIRLQCEEDSGHFKVISFAVEEPDDEHLLHSQGDYSPELTASTELTTVLNIEEIKQRCDQCFTGKEHVQSAQKLQLKLGHHFHWIEQVVYNDIELLADMRPADKVEAKRYILYPGFIDSCFQTLLAWFRQMDEGILQIPLNIKRLQYDLSVNSPKYVYIRLPEGQTAKTADFSSVDILICDAQGKAP